MIKKPNYYKNYFSLTEDKRALPETALDLTIWDQRILEPSSQATKYPDKKYILKTISVYGELDPRLKHRTQFVFKDKREHIAKVNMPNIVYPNQHIDIEILHGSRYHVIVPDSVKITFTLTLNQQTRHVVL